MAACKAASMHTTSWFVSASRHKDAHFPLRRSAYDKDALAIAASAAGAGISGAGACARRRP